MTKVPVTLALLLWAQCILAGASTSNPCGSFSTPCCDPEATPISLGIAQCSLGFYCPRTNPANATTAPVFCAPVSRCQIDRLETSFCDPQGEYEPVLCPRGYYCPDPQTKVQCPSGHFCPPGTYEPLECPALSTCEAGSKVRRFWGAIVIMLCADAVLVGIICMYRLKKKRTQLKHRQSNLALLQMDSPQRDMGNVNLPRVTRHLVRGFRNAKGPIKELVFEFSRLSLTLPSGQQILQSVTGSLRPGRVTAVMGPSGAGKTTFLYSLMGKMDARCKTDGTLSINGVKNAYLPDFRKVVGYVPQDDVMLHELTVWENIAFSARMRLPPHWSSKQVDEHVRTVVSALELDGPADVAIGDATRRGVSGGQRKRCNIGIELAAAPLALFLDEPTSGLDSSAALHVSHLLHALARETNMTIAMVIHQPRMEIWNSLDEVLLLARGGHTVFEGPQKLAEAYFNTQLHVVFPNHENPADVIMDATAERGTLYAQNWVQNGPGFIASLHEGLGLGKSLPRWMSGRNLAMLAGAQVGYAPRTPPQVAVALSTRPVLPSAAVDEPQGFEFQPVADVEPSTEAAYSSDVDMIKFRMIGIYFQNTKRPNASKFLAAIQQPMSEWDGDMRRLFQQVVLNLGADGAAGAPMQSAGPTADLEKSILPNQLDTPAAKAVATLPDTSPTLSPSGTSDHPSASPTLASDVSSSSSYPDDSPPFMATSSQLSSVSEASPSEETGDRNSASSAGPPINSVSSSSEVKAKGKHHHVVFEQPVDGALEPVPAPAIVEPTLDNSVTVTKSARTLVAAEIGAVSSTRTDYDAPITKYHAAEPSVELDNLRGKRFIKAPKEFAQSMSKIPRDQPNDPNEETYVDVYELSADLAVRYEIRGASFLTQVATCHLRSLRQQHEKLYSWVLECFLTSLGAVIIGLGDSGYYQGIFIEPYVRLSASPVDFVPQVCMMLNTAIGLAAATAGVRLFSEEQQVYWREAGAGHNRLAYFIGVSTAAMYRQVLAALHFAAFFHVVAQPIYNFSDLYACVLLLFYAVYGMSSVISMLVKRENGPLLAVVVALIFAVMGGSIKKIPAGIKQLSYAWWATEALYDKSLLPFIHVYQVEAISQPIWGLTLHQFSLDLWMIFVIGSAWRVVAYFLMVRTHIDKQR